jgi:pilus assembly protein Flp/PilA
MPLDPACIEETIPARRMEVPQQRDRGASLVEYAFLLALIAVVCLGAVTYFGSSTGDSFSTSGSSMFASN